MLASLGAMLAGPGAALPSLGIVLAHTARRVGHSRRCAAFVRGPQPGHHSDEKRDRPDGG